MIILPLMFVLGYTTVLWFRFRSTRQRLRLAEYELAHWRTTAPRTQTQIAEAEQRAKFFAEQIAAKDQQITERLAQQNQILAEQKDRIETLEHQLTHAVPAPHTFPYPINPN